MGDAIRQDEAADYLGISVTHFQRLCRCGLVLAVKKNSRWFTKYEWLNVYLFGDVADVSELTVEEFIRDIARAN